MTESALVEPAALVTLTLGVAAVAALAGLLWRLSQGSAGASGAERLILVIGFVAAGLGVVALATVLGATLTLPGDVAGLLSVGAMLCAVGVCFVAAALLLLRGGGRAVGVGLAARTPDAEPAPDRAAARRRQNSAAREKWLS